VVGRSRVCHISLARGKQLESGPRTPMSQLDCPLPTTSHEPEEKKRNGKSDRLWPLANC